jgi:RNA polymerase sporulation-specific sigma factor
MGLIKAVNKYDPSYNVKFSTYAVPMIMGEIKRFLRDDGIIKVSRSLKELSNKARILKEEMTMELGREPSVNEMAERLGMEPEDLVMAIESSYTPESLYSEVTDGDRVPTPLIDRIEGGYEDTDYSRVDRIALKQVLETLKPRERQIIVLRYFKEKTQVQVAEMLGISQVQVSRIEKRIINEMRKQINAT